MAIVGPTGAGKSVLALRIAEKFGGEIVNCDSLQLYRGFDVGTAKLPESRRLGIPHHLFDALDPSQGYSAGEYARQARETIAGISARESLPIVAGGTGFYLRALLCGLPPLPQRDQTLRARLAERERNRPGILYRLLQRLDPAAAVRIHRRDVQKLIRALEVRMLTRAPLPSPAAAAPLTGYRILQVGLDPDRAQLHLVLNARVCHMFHSGLIEEVQRLLSEGRTGLEKPFESLGYKQALRYVQGQVRLEEAIASTQLETRQYAKRQMTWLRRDPQIYCLHGFGDSPTLVQRCFEYVREFLSAQDAAVSLPI